MANNMGNMNDGRKQDNLSPEQRSEIGRKGGEASHPHGRGLENASAETKQRVSSAGGQASRGGSNSNNN